jgi:hypothetical protein
VAARLTRIDASPASSVVTCSACPSFRALRTTRAGAAIAAAEHRAAFHKHAAADATSKSSRRAARSSTLRGVPA